jgi:periplasmic protein TonB
MNKTYTFFTLALLFLAQQLSGQIWEYNELTKKYRIIDSEFQPINNAEYDEVTPYNLESERFYMVRNGNRRGIVDPKGRLTIPIEYLEVRPWANQSEKQFGFVSITKDQRTWGLIDARTGVSALPIKFEFTRAIFPDLLVGRVFADSTLQFFDGQGKPLFQVFGRSVRLGFDDNSMKVERVDRSEYFADKKGKPIFPPNLKRPQWTDGTHVICIENGKYGLVTMSGQQILPFEWIGIIPMNTGQFWVKNQNREEGLIDASGKFIIPLASGSLHLPYGKIGSSMYIRSGIGSDYNFNETIYDTTGKILFSNVRMLSINVSVDRTKVPFVLFNDYFEVQEKGKNERYIFHYKKGQILANAWTSIWYGSEKHTIIAIRNDAENRQVEFKAFDLNGRLVFDAPKGMTLQHTHNPQLLLATKDNQFRAALIDLNNMPEKAVFDYRSINQLKNGWFVVVQNYKSGLLDPNGKMVVKPADLTSLNDPNLSQYKEFREAKHVRGKLIASGTYSGLNYPSWVAVNEFGESTVFEPKPAPVKPPKPVAVVTSDTPILEEINRVPEVEEVPQQQAPSDESDVKELFDVEKPPTYPGGEAEIQKFIAANIQYPAIAKENNIQGTVALSFIVEKDGSITNIKILKDPGGGCGKEAMRLVGTMPKWTPGQYRGQVVRVKYVAPVRFRLD